MQWFVDNMTEAEATKQFRRLRTKYHPDHGGKAEDFVALEEAYQQVLAECRKPCPHCHGMKTVMQFEGFSSIAVLCPVCKGSKQ